VCVSRDPLVEEGNVDQKIALRGRGDAPKESVKSSGMGMKLGTREKSREIPALHMGVLAEGELKVKSGKEGANCGPTQKRPLGEAEKTRVQEGKKNGVLGGGGGGHFSSLRVFLNLPWEEIKRDKG